MAEKYRNKVRDKKEKERGKERERGREGGREEGREGDHECRRETSWKRGLVAVGKCDHSILNTSIKLSKIKKKNQ